MTKQLELSSSTALLVLFLFKKIIGLDVGFPQDGPERAFRDVAWMVLDGGVSVGFFVVPDLMASGSLSVKGKPESLELLYDLPAGDTGRTSKYQSA